jgi:thiaminase/transcriptional activator TenA
VTAFSARLWCDNRDLAAAALEHPFVRGIADGSLPPAVFAGYVGQDAFFLGAFAEAYGAARAASRDARTRDAFTGLLEGVRDELRLHSSYAAALGVDLSSVEPSAATLAYTDFLGETAGLGDVASICAAMTPCMRLYAHLGASLSDRPHASGYRDWISAYADPAFEQLARTLESLLDAHAVGSEPERTTYRRAMELEVAFFDAAVAG